MFPCVSADMEVTEAEQRRQVEEQVEKLLSGQGLEVSGCDVGLEQSKPATLRKNVTYIVCAVIFNDKVQLPVCALCCCWSFVASESSHRPEGHWLFIKTDGVKG